jgi:hypothetical protein
VRFFARQIRFRLKTLLVLVGLVAFALYLYRSWRLTPMQHGTISSAICAAEDWKALTKSLPHSQQGDFVLYCFDASDPKGVFQNFSVEPEIWATIDIAEYMSRDEDGISLGSTGHIRNRPADSPISGASGTALFPNPTLDVITVEGTFERSVTWPTVYKIKCEVYFGSGPSTGVTLTKSDTLSYQGQPRGNLLVFSRPIDERLVRLLIIDLH